MCGEYEKTIMGYRYRKIVDNYFVFYIIVEDIVEIYRIFKFSIMSQNRYFSDDISMAILFFRCYIFITSIFYD